MKYLIASDLHGSAFYTEKLLEAFENERADKLVLLGDLLYHGPRNDLPRDYDTKKTTKLLNAYKDRIIAVRGNCDAEVDQMVLEFPIMADYVILDNGHNHIFATHGHLYNNDELPPLSDGDILLHGHTHIVADELHTLKRDDGEDITYAYCNPGSVSIPKDGKRGYFTLDSENLEWKNLI